MHTEEHKALAISQKIKHYRRIHNLSQEELAHTSGVSIRTVQRMEKGESIGSAYTLKALAHALHIDASELVSPEQLPQEMIEPAPAHSERNRLKLLNLSALAVIVFPLANIIIPAIILWRTKHNEAIHPLGRKIISFHLLWALGTLLTMVIIPFVLLVFAPLRGSSIPLFVPVYFLCLILNVLFTLRVAISLNKHDSFLEGFPNLL